MKVTCDAAKRARTLKERGLDFADAAKVFATETLDIPDDRRDYDEPRVRTFGWLGKRLVCVVWTPRAASRRVISMRYANDREKKAYSEAFGS